LQEYLKSVSSNKRVKLPTIIPLILGQNYMILVNDSTKGTKKYYNGQIVTLTGFVGDKLVMLSQTGRSFALPTYK